MNNGDFSMLVGAVAHLLKENDFHEVDENSLQYRKLCAEIHKAEIELIPLQIKNMSGDFSYRKDLPDVFPELFSSAVEVPTRVDEQESMKLSEVIDAYWKENIRAENWEPRTITEYTTPRNLIEKLLGDPPIRSIDHKTMQTFKDNLLKLPTNYMNSKKYEKLPIEEVIKMKHERTLSIRTVNDWVI